MSEWVSKWVSELVSEWVSEWVSTCIVPRLPRKRGGAPRDARAYIRPFGNAHCLTPATQKRRSPKGRQGVHLTPWQCTLSHACHAKAAEPQGTPGRTSDPLAVHVAHCLTPATQKRRSPKGRQGVHLTPWQCTLSHACHAKAAEPQGTPGRTSDPLTRWCMPWQCTLSHACHAKEAEPHGTPGRTSDPLAVHIVPRLPRKRGGAPRDARAYIRPLGSADCPTPATQKRRSPKGRQGVHQTPWQCTLSDACHAKEAEPQETPGRTSDPLAVHIVPRLPCKRSGAPRDARAYIRPLGSAHCPTPATQKRRSPKGRQGVHPTPWQCTWQCTLSHACHAKAAEPQGTPGRTSNPLAVHIVPRLPRKMHIGPRLPREWVSEWVSVWVSEWVSVWVSECVSEWVSESEWVTEWREAAGGGGRRRKADTELKTKTPHVNVGNKTPNVDEAETAQDETGASSSSKAPVRKPTMNKAISPSKVGIQVIREKFEEMNNSKSIDTGDYQRFQEVYGKWKSSKGEEKKQHLKEAKELYKSIIYPKLKSK